MNHLLSIQELSAEQITHLVQQAVEIKAKRGKPNQPKPLQDQVWGIMFSKSSTRTRVSFEVGLRELGAAAMFLSANDIQLGRGEPIKDTARVIGRMAHGAIIRNDSQSDIQEFAKYSGIPTINALTEEEHPCQILADLLTIQEKLGTWEGKTVSFIGDGDCNVARSWMWAAARLGFKLIVAAPEKFQPPAEYREKLGVSNITFTDDVKAAAAESHVLYTDVWVSMGREEEAAERLEILAPYQVNKALVDSAQENAIVLHCLPAYREKEITEEVLELHADTIFQEAENRLHAQKAVLVELAKA
ncbi:MAG: ornithine carbamoyltransferase [Verrucomicrobiales bacterium]|jgi:ornithine carbamoyltransferase